mmetsp:Transcript_11624/g.35814  ORF Transcript_11624/g.35814 Transcript_11624/m.35814 type:complete len:546 (-) Transcript_11624:12-1649(-)
MVTRVGANTPIYCLSEGATLPTWVTSDRARRKALKADERLNRRVELLQGLEFDGGVSRRVKYSSDGSMLVVTGEYPPACKVYDLSQLGMKYERRLRAPCVDVWPLAPDLGKMVFLLDDRTLDFHAPYGTHHSLRVPSAGRRLLYDAERCGLMVASGQRPVAHRLDLDAGRFDRDLELESPSSCCHMPSSGVPLAAFGCEDGACRFVDLRCAATASTLNVGHDVTAVAFDGDGLRVACGTADAYVNVYDLRSSKPQLRKIHQNDLPVVDIRWHASSAESRKQLILSSDARTIKAWDARTGAIECNVEPSSPMTHLAVAPAGDGDDSGLLLCAGEQSRVMAYYVPTLGRAPRWCAFLDSLTEELEEADRQVYDDYRFVSKTELEDLGGASFVGTPQLRAHMHGYFMDARLYKRLRAAAAPYAYEDYKKQKVAKALKAKQESRIRRADAALPAVNADYAKRLLEDETDEVDGSGDEVAKTAKARKRKPRREKPADATASNPLGDDRFGAMFTDERFEVDTTSNEWALRHPSIKPKEAASTGGKRKGKR